MQDLLQDLEKIEEPLKIIDITAKKSPRLEREHFILLTSRVGK